jgi:acylphosphatase
VKQAVSGSSIQRRDVHYSGSVQGVGFRLTACQTASRFAVTGFVQNLADGRVRLVAEGNAGELDAFLAAIAQRMGGNIRNVTVDVRPATGEISDFSTRH